MSLVSRALVALSLVFIGCSGSDSGPDKGHGVGDDDDDTTLQPGTGGVVINVTLDGVEVTDAYVFLDGVELGQVGETIPDLEPGDYVFDIGKHLPTLTLDGAPYYFDPNDSANKRYLGQVSVNVLKGEIASASGSLELAPQHQCASRDCGWPYEGSRGACDGPETVDPPVWIEVHPDDNGLIMRAKEFSIDNLVSSVKMYLDDGIFTAEPANSSVEIMAADFDPEELTLSVIVSSDAFEASEQTICAPM